MATFFETMGFAFESEEDCKAIFKRYARDWARLVANDRELYRLILGGNIRIYSLRHGGNADCDLHYATDTRTELCFTGKYRYDRKDSPFGMAALSYPAPNGETAGLVARIPDYCLQTMREGPYLMQVAAYAQNVAAFSSYEVFRLTGLPFGAETYYPYGGIDKNKKAETDPDDPNFVPTGRTVIVGPIQFFERRVNPATGLPYYYFKVSVLGLTIDVLAAAESVLPEELRIGGTLLVDAMTVSARAIKRVEKRAG